MRRLSLGRGTRLLAPLGLVLAAGCSLQFCADDAFVRDALLRTGEIEGTAVLPAGEGPAAFAQAFVSGTSFVRRTDSSGRFLFSGLREGPWVVVVSEDENGDGVPERRRVSSAVLRHAPHRYAAFSEAQPALTGVDIGEVVLEGTVRVNGRVLVEPVGGGAAVPPSDLGFMAIVVAGRDFELPTPSGEGFDPVALGVEGKSGVDATGAFSLSNISGGDFYVSVLLYDSGATPGIPGRLVAASPRVDVNASDQTVQVPDDIVVPAPGALEEVARREGQLLFSPAPKESEQVYLSFVPPGREQPACESSPPDLTGSFFESYTVLSAQRGAGPSVPFPDLPVGAWDVRACFTDSPFGDLYGQLIAPPDGDASPLLLAPVLLTDQQACVASRPCQEDADCQDPFICNEQRGQCELSDPDSRWFDCDGDGRRGLPLLVDLTGADLDTWRDCRETCAVFPVGDTTCRAGNDNDYDCDDDGDGLADVFEVPACYGVGKGGDTDGDGICDGVDSWPRCRDNTAEDCDALREDGPQVPALYESELQCLFQREPNSVEWCAIQGLQTCSEQSLTCEILEDGAGGIACTCCFDAECAELREYLDPELEPATPFACVAAEEQMLWDGCFATADATDAGTDAADGGGVAPAPPCELSSDCSEHCTEGFGYCGAAGSCACETCDVDTVQASEVMATGVIPEGTRCVVGDLLFSYEPQLTTLGLGASTLRVVDGIFGLQGTSMGRLDLPALVAITGDLSLRHNVGPSGSLEDVSAPELYSIGGALKVEHNTYLPMQKVIDLLTQLNVDLGALPVGRFQGHWCPAVGEAAPCDLVDPDSTCAQDYSDNPVCQPASAPFSCGNGRAESGEECDGDDLMGATCEALGYTGGTVSCNSTCFRNIDLCTGA